MLDCDEMVEGDLVIFLNDFMLKQRQFVCIIMYKRDKRLELRIKKVIFNYC